MRVWGGDKEGKCQCGWSLRIHAFVLVALHCPLLRWLLLSGLVRSAWDGTLSKEAFACAKNRGEKNSNTTCEMNLIFVFPRFVIRGCRRSPFNLASRCATLPPSLLRTRNRYTCCPLPLLQPILPRKIFRSFAEFFPTSGGKVALESCHAHR